MRFFEKLHEAARRNRSLLCVGLDTDPARLPANLKGAAHGAARFNRALVEATQDLACAYKLNFAFYEAQRAAGWALLEETLRAIPPEIPVIADLRVAEKARQWNTRGNCGLVVGATHPEQMAAVRRAAPDLPFLVPGVGAQGGAVDDVAANAPMAGGAVRLRSPQGGFIINASRSILHASTGPDFAEAARREAARLRDEINVALARVCEDH
ncbi:MAG: orotidine 5'-phosphate decarboxylase [Candidatus Sumerlaeota bacterium]|nr:orotidine 5'-phosphate decarboxylase [Candidatus Sumerlaeota bacterium]